MFRVAALIAAALQFSLIAFGPIVDGRDGVGAPSHVEAFGISLHYSHNPDNCAACTAAALVGPPVHSAVAVIPEPLRRAARPPVRVVRGARNDRTPKSPRAPPGPMTRLA